MKNQYQHLHIIQLQDTYKETNVSLLQELRANVATELLAQTGLYKPEDKETNIRIINDIRKTIAGMDSTTPEAKHIAEVVIAANENIQIRDFLMGLSAEPLDIDDIFDYLLLVGCTAVKEKAVPVATVFAAYLYERNKEEAKDTIREVLAVNPDYSLANLLNKVFAADTDAGFLKAIASDLHSKVIDIIYEKETNDNDDVSA